MTSPFFSCFLRSRFADDPAVEESFPDPFADLCSWLDLPASLLGGIDPAEPGSAGSGSEVDSKGNFFVMQYPASTRRARAFLDHLRIQLCLGLLVMCGLRDLRRFILESRILPSRNIQFIPASIQEVSWAARSAGVGFRTERGMTPLIAICSSIPPSSRLGA